MRLASGCSWSSTLRVNPMCNLLDRRHSGPEDIGVQAVVIPELELGNVEREILRRHLLERPNNTTLELAPKAFNMCWCESRPLRSACESGLPDHAAYPRRAYRENSYRSKASRPRAAPFP